VEGYASFTTALLAFLQVDAILSVPFEIRHLKRRREVSNFMREFKIGRERDE